MTTRRGLKGEVVAAFTFGIVFLLAAIGLAIFFPRPSSFQSLVFRSVLALSAAGVAAVIPGFLHINSTAQNFGLRAGGAIVVFLIVYGMTPAVPAASEEDRARNARRDALQSSFTDFINSRSRLNTLARQLNAMKKEGKEPSAEFLVLGEKALTDRDVATRNLAQALEGLRGFFSKNVMVLVEDFRKWHNQFAEVTVDDQPPDEEYVKWRTRLFEAMATEMEVSI